MTRPSSKISSLFTSLFLLQLGSTALAQQTESKNPSLSAMHSAERIRAARIASLKYKTLVQELLSVAQTDIKIPQRQFDEPKELAINLLGTMRSAEAVDFLANNINLQVLVARSEILPFVDHPCVRALIQIGNPSVQEILRRMKPLYDGPEFPERDLHLFAYIIREVDGHEVGLFRLQLAAKDAKGTQKLNLLNLIEIYQKQETEAQIVRAISTEMLIVPPSIR